MRYAIGGGGGGGDGMKKQRKKQITEGTLTCCLPKKVNMISEIF